MKVFKVIWQWMKEGADLYSWPLFLLAFGVWAVAAVCLVGSVLALLIGGE